MTSEVLFADTSYYIALVSPRDKHHAAATGFTRLFDGRIVTSSLILAGLGSFFAVGTGRRVFAQLDDMIRRDPAVEHVILSADEIDSAVQVFLERTDKEWSLTDCSSFHLMTQRNLRAALATDHHFRQAGFQTPLLNP